MNDSTPRCVDCGTIYAVYPDEDTGEWWCNECREDREEATRWLA